jgi:2-phospho-L-lactate/phosphoenolpyruvate guanylyltransferase
VLAIVPVKGRDGKKRLEGVLSAAERTRLVEAMLADVLAACERAASVSSVLVVTPDPEVVPERVDVLVDEGAGHAAALERALADERTADGALVVMADCPLVSPESLDRLVEEAAPVALAPARDGGINALALRSRIPFEPGFGLADAAAVTVARARASGVAVVVVDDPALAFDVDHPADVWKLREHARRGRSHAVLAEMLPPTGGLL